MRYIKALDGCRAVAVLLVMLFHFGYLAVGWIGVQIFFTLSGYLITGILLRDRQSSFSSYVTQFYWRRTLRIFPLFYAFLIVIAASYVLFRAPESFSSDWIWLVSYTANFARMRDADLGPYFIHIWSLAVEEQFYLIWPLLLYFLPLKGFRWVVGGFLLLSPLLRYLVFDGMISLGHNEQYAGKAVYVLPFMQFDAFAAGAIIPLWGLEKMERAGRWFLGTLALTAIAGFGILASAHLWGKGAFLGSLGYAHYLILDHGYVWGYSLLNILSMFGIICVLQRKGPVRLLEGKLPVWIGKVSYGIYVYHLPLLLAGEYMVKSLGMTLHGGTQLVFFAAWIATVAIVSHLSFVWLESPILKYKSKWTRPFSSTPQPEQSV